VGFGVGCLFRYVSGAVLRVLRDYPGQYVAHVVAADGTSQVWLAGIVACLEVSITMLVCFCCSSASGALLVAITDGAATCCIEQ